MAKDCDKITEMMEEQGCMGKRVTKELIESRIEDVDYKVVVIAGQKMMFCGIKMLGGFVAVGKPAVCIDPTNWRDEIGQKISYDNSFEELWKLEAYHMMYPAPMPKISILTTHAGFQPVLDNGVVKHICRVGSAHCVSVAFDDVTDKHVVKVKVANTEYSVISQDLPIAEDVLVIMDSNSSDVYLATAASFTNKQLVSL